MPRTQQIRVRNLLLNHAPGATLETIEGPVVVRTFDSLNGTLRNIRGKQFPGDFSILEQRLSSQMPAPGIDPPRLHRIPSNAELGWSDSRKVVDTRAFPRWELCNNPPEHEHGVLFDSYSHSQGCPQCNEKDNSSAIRFVQYCEKGHLDDLSWSYRLHGSGDCDPKYLVWRERDASRGGVTISCPDCPKSATLSQISNSIQKCTGRRPEKEEDGGLTHRDDCANRPKVTLRQSAVLWQSVTQSVISTPKDDPLKKLIFEFYGRTIRNGFTMDETFEGQPNEETLQELSEENRMGGVQVPDDPEAKRILTHIWRTKRLDTDRHLWPTLIELCRRAAESGANEFRRSWEGLSSTESKSATKDSFNSEFRAMMDHGDLPSFLEDPSTGRRVFQMDGNFEEAPFGGLHLVIRPIPVLRSVTALIGYTRGAIDLKSGSEGTMVNLSHNSHGTPWYAATESMGEGILIHLREGSQFSKGNRWEKWEKTHNEATRGAIQEQPQETVPWPLFRSAASARRIDEDWVPEASSAPEYFAESHPVFVWWHTLAHHMIRAIQAETGYSSSAIRERVYAAPDADGKWSGAMVLSVTDGMDGTLGGLISLLPNFVTFAEKASRTAMTCSNDPLCEEAPKMGEMHQIGCYACTLNPETSCEHRNMFLDRLLLLEGAGLG
jgi:hypothetical protein